MSHFGSHDFILQSSHLWGTGSALREFVHENHDDGNWKGRVGGGGGLRADELDAMTLFISMF